MMRSSRLTAWIPLVWTLTMTAWLLLYERSHATCGPEIQRDCSIGVSVTAGLGQPGIVLLWALGLAAFAVAWLTNRHRAAKTPQRPQRRRLRAAGDVALLAAVVAPLVLVALPAAPRSTREGSVPATAAVDVRVISAILHPSASSAGRNRHAARVTVHVRLNNRSGRRVTLRPPMLLSGGAALPYDRRQFALKPLDPGAAVDSRLRFEPRSAFTQRLVTERDAQLQIAARTIPLTLKIGAPVRKSPLRGVSSRPDARRRAARPRPVVAPATRRPPPRPAPSRAGPPPPAPPPPPAAPPPQRLPEREQDPAAPAFDDSG